MIIIKPRFLKRRLGRQFLAAILGPSLVLCNLHFPNRSAWQVTLKSGSVAMFVKQKTASYNIFRYLFYRILYSSFQYFITYQYQTESYMQISRGSHVILHFTKE
jgi:hypothetical protein